MALSLRARGFHAFALTGGYKAWREAGYPVEEKADEMERALDGSCPQCGHPWAEHAATP